MPRVSAEAVVGVVEMSPPWLQLLVVGPRRDAAEHSECVERSACPQAACHAVQGTASVGRLIIENLT